MSARFARPYAEALLASVPASSDPEKVLAPLRDVAAAVAGSSVLRAVLAHPSVKKDAKRQILRSVGEKAGVDELGSRFLGLVLDNGRVLRLSEILAAVGVALDAREGVVPAHVTVASEIDAAARERVAAALSGATGKKVRANFTTDPRLLAGFVARVGSTVYDASALGAIQQFEEEAHGN
jgi:F-type H+-transporting ATPase subunit delta